MKYAVSAQHKDGAIPMDAIDRKILAILQEDSSVAISEIAASVGLSATPCWKRVQKLEASGVIMRHVALLSPEKLGLGLSVYVSIVASELSTPESYCSGWPARKCSRDASKKAPDIGGLFACRGFF